jgi:hypothetical protein
MFIGQGLDRQGVKPRLANHLKLPVNHSPATHDESLLLAKGAMGYQWQPSSAFFSFLISTGETLPFEETLS